MSFVIVALKFRQVKGNRNVTSLQLGMDYEEKFSLSRIFVLYKIIIVDGVVSMPWDFL